MGGRGVRGGEAVLGGGPWKRFSLGQGVKDIHEENQNGGIKMVSGSAKKSLLTEKGMG
jgi:hypothetical protein